MRRVALLVVLVAAGGCTWQGLDEGAQRVRQGAESAAKVIGSAPLPAPVRAPLVGIAAAVAAVAMGLERLAHGFRARRQVAEREATIATVAGEADSYQVLFDLVSEAVDTSATCTQAAITRQLKELLAARSLSVADLRAEHHKSILRRLSNQADGQAARQ